MTFCIVGSSEWNNKRKTCIYTNPSKLSDDQILKEINTLIVDSKVSNNDIIFQIDFNNQTIIFMNAAGAEKHFQVETSINDIIDNLSSRESMKANDEYDEYEDKDEDDIQEEPSSNSSPTVFSNQQATSSNVTIIPEQILQTLITTNWLTERVARLEAEVTGLRSIIYGLVSQPSMNQVGPYFQQVQETSLQPSLPSTGNENLRAQERASSSQPNPFIFFTPNQAPSHSRHLSSSTRIKTSLGKRRVIQFVPFEKPREADVGTEGANSESENNRNQAYKHIYGLLRKAEWEEGNKKVLKVTEKMLPKGYVSNNRKYRLPTHAMIHSVVRCLKRRFKDETHVDVKEHIKNPPRIELIAETEQAKKFANDELQKLSSGGDEAELSINTALKNY